MLLYTDAVSTYFCACTNELNVPMAAFEKPNEVSNWFVPTASCWKLITPKALLLVCSALKLCVMYRPVFAVCRPISFVRLIAKSCVALMLNQPGKPRFGGAFATRLPQLNVGILFMRVPSQNGGCSWLSACTA